MKQRWIHVYVGEGEHGYHHLGVFGPFDGMLDALKELVTRHGNDFVDEQIEWLVTGSMSGEIAWVTDVLGYSIERTPHE